MFILGGNHTIWVKFLESINGIKYDFKDFVDLKTPFFDIEYNIFLQKLNSVYLDNTVSSLLDDSNCNLIHYYILDTFESLIYT